MLTKIVNILPTCNIQQLIDYILTDESDVTKCFSLTGSFRDEINCEFVESSLDEDACEDESSLDEEYSPDASSNCISDDWCSKELLQYSHSTSYADMDEDSICTTFLNTSSTHRQTPSYMKKRMNNLLISILNNLRTCNIQQLINYILTDESDITKCFSLTGSFRDEINLEFNENSLDEDADMDEDSHCRDISFSSLADSITDGGELVLQEVNRSIGENSQAILELLQLYRLTDPQLKRALEVGRASMLIVK